MRRGGAKWDDVPAGAIATSIADMELGTPPVVVDAALDEVRRGGGYAGSALTRGMLEAGARWWRRHGLVMDVDRCLPIGSVSAALAFAMVRTSSPGDGIVRLRPTYPPLVDAIAASDRRDLAVDLVRSNGTWEIDLEAFEAACAEARLLLWVAPHNPTGRVWRQDEVVAVAEIAARHGLVVLSDEIWGDVLLGGARHVPFEPVAREVDWQLMERTLTVVGTSKAWNLADLGAAILHTDSDELWRRLHGPGPVPLLARPGRVELRAAQAAWREGEPWLTETLTTIERNVDAAVVAFTSAFGADRVTRPQGTYLVWLDLRGLVPDDDPMAVLAVPDGVVPSNGARFGAPGFIRCNLATTPEEAAEAVARVIALVGAAG